MCLLGALAGKLWYCRVWVRLGTERYTEQFAMLQLTTGRNGKDWDEVRTVSLKKIGCDMHGCWFNKIALDPLLFADRFNDETSRVDSHQERGSKVQLKTWVVTCIDCQFKLSRFKIISLHPSSRPYRLETPWNNKFNIRWIDTRSRARNTR